MIPVPVYFCKLTVLDIGVLTLLLGTPNFSAMQLGTSRQDEHSMTGQYR